MQINPKLIKKQFEKSFNSYNQNAIVQRLMAEKLVKNLSLIKTTLKPKDKCRLKRFPA